MKYKADYSNKMTFHQVLSSFNSDKKYIAFLNQKNIDKEKLFETKIISFNIFGEIFIDGKHDDTGKYQELIILDWFEVHEVKEDPKKESYVTKEQIDEYNKRTGEYWNKIRDKKHCQKILSELKKENVVYIQEEMVIDGLNITDHIITICKQEIAKENDRIKSGIKPTTVETLIDKLDEKNPIDHWSKMLYIAKEGTNKNESLEEFQKRVVPGWKPTKEGYDQYVKEKWATQTLSALGKLQDENFTDERQLQIDKVRKLLNKKPKKPKQEFDGEEKIWSCTYNGLWMLIKSKEAPRFCNTWMLVNQEKINKFFKGIKKRIKISEKYDKPSNRSFYFKNGVKYYHDLRSGSYYTYGKDNYIKYITEQEYLEGLK